MNTQQCSKCKLYKPLSKDFFNTRDRLGKKFRTDCKECQGLKQAEAYQKKREIYKQNTKNYRAKLRKINQNKMWEFLLQHPCVACGESNPVLLDCDHISDKRYNISDIIYCHTWQSIQAELQKCQILCVGCHRKKTAKDFGWYQHIEHIDDYLSS